MKPIEFLFEREIIHSYAQKARSTGRGNPRGIIIKPDGIFRAVRIFDGATPKPRVCGGVCHRGRRGDSEDAAMGSASGVCSPVVPSPRLTGATSERGRGTAGTQREARGRVGAVDTEGQRPVYDTSPALRGGGRTGTPELHAAQILGRG